ncbi:hypothetical protein ABL78_7104 [Leptomonas seymouri]|uniref:Uncharacterized protein n=1 Tax=Leptomonas seymouri TaxID=5684 RepID=A0A0N1PBF6_LEPSE|nr:hypothetical protein ABL78_7104 [Leptomonas seymouri]|eukprot:KPI83854.1 hypothetical protein ABL78_7104 [Leptomonas seymouri]
MFQRTCSAYRYRTAWRELLHPLPVWARKAQWLKRDTVEINEAALREPYYRIKSYAQPAAYTAPRVSGSAAQESSTHQSSRYSVEEQLRRPRQALSPERLQELREQLQLTDTCGPTLRSSAAGPAYSDEYGHRLRPRYPESWDTVPPHQPSHTPG